MSESETNILEMVMPRLIPKKKGEAILGLEIMHGPYRGVTFSFKAFRVSKKVGPDGMVPTKFETEVHESPKGFHATEDFDYFCGEVLMAWLSYISLSNFEALLSSETKGVH